jgi:hypothetical protein
VPRRSRVSWICRKLATWVARFFIIHNTKTG